MDHVVPPSPQPAVAFNRNAFYPQTFAPVGKSAAADVYLSEPAVAKLLEFFQAKGLAALKEEDRAERWYDDWIAWQREHRIYASVLSPRQYSSHGSELDLLRLAKFLEVFAWHSPAHGYSFQVTFLGLFSVLMGNNSALKQEAVAALEAGGLLAFGVSEKNHGSDLLANEFVVREETDGRRVANGSKYYIGNANFAAMIPVLARSEGGSGPRDRREPFILFALRPAQTAGFTLNLRKIPTLGVRSAMVCELGVRDHEVAPGDIIAEGRLAWEAVFGAITLGKFFLGFGSIGICEHAMAEAIDHLSGRILYGKPVIEMPHIRAKACEAYARLTAMKLYAYRALDYVHAATANDRRYLLFNAVQKAKVSTEGVKVMALLSECMGAKGFESDTYFEMALRDIQLIPGLEGSAHINLAQAARFIPRYFTRPDSSIAAPPSLFAGEIPSRENPYLMEAKTGGINSIAFPDFLAPYQALSTIPNVRLFSRQARAMSRFLIDPRSSNATTTDVDTDRSIKRGACLATIAYAQLIAENAACLQLAPQMVAAIFHTLVMDLSVVALEMASSSDHPKVRRYLARRVVAVPTTSAAEWDSILARSF